MLTIATGPDLTLISTNAQILRAPASDGQPRPLRRADHDPGEAWPRVRREMEIRAGAAARAESRVVVAIWRALGFSQGEISDSDAREAAARCEWARGGVGGPGGYSGDATARPPWAQSLGKGRRQADDGPAWDAALESAARILAPGGANETDHARAIKAATGEELIFAAAHVLRQIEGAGSPEGANAWASLLPGIEASAWGVLGEHLIRLGDVAPNFLGDALRWLELELDAARRLEALMRRWECWGAWSLHGETPRMEMDHGWTVIRLGHVSARCRWHRRDIAAAFKARGWFVRDIPAERRVRRAADRLLAKDGIIVRRGEVDRG